MQKFARHRTLEEIASLIAAMPGFTLDSTKHDREGHDHVVIEGRFGGIKSGLPARLLYNTFNGRFFGEVFNVGMVNSDDTKHDGKPWFDAMLEFFYVSAAAEKVA